MVAVGCGAVNNCGGSWPVIADFLGSAVILCNPGSVVYCTGV